MIRRYTKINSELSNLLEKFLAQEDLHELLIVLRNVIREQDSKSLVFGEYAAVLEQITSLLNQKYREQLSYDKI